MQSYLEAIFGQGNILVTSTTTLGVYDITFQGIYAGTNVGLMSTTAGTNVVTSIGGDASQTELVNLAGATGGNFTLSYNGATTTALPFNATSQAVDNALTALTTLGPAANNTVEQVQFNAGTTSGTFTLAYNAATTGNITFVSGGGVSQAQNIANALAALGTIGGGTVAALAGGNGYGNNNVQVTTTGNALNFNITFTGSLGATPQTLLVPNGANLVGSTTVTVVNTAVGANSNIIVQNPSAGLYYIQFAGALAGGAESQITVDPTNGGTSGLTFPANTLARNVTSVITALGGVTEPQFAPAGTGTLSLTDGASTSALVKTGTNRLVIGGNVIVTPFAGITTSTAAQITGNIALTAPTALAAATRSFTVGDSPAANDLTITASIVDGSPFATGITKLGTGWGRLVLNPSTASTYTGTTTITNGVVTAQANSALGLGLLGVASAGTTIGGSGALELSGGITLTDEAITNSSFGYYDQNPTRWGNTPIGGGGLRSISGANAILSSLTNQAGTLVTLNAANNSVGVDAGSLTISAVINETQQTFKVGQGTLVVAGATSNTGAAATLIQDGTVQVNKPGNAVAFSGTVTVGDNHTISGNTDVLQWGPQAGSFQLPSGVTVVVQSTGKLDLATNARNATFTALNLIEGVGTSADVEIGAGHLGLTGGIVSVALGAALGSSTQASVINSTTGVLSLPTNNQTIQVQRGTGLADLIINATMVDLDTINLNKTGSGVWVINGSQALYEGPTTVNEGTLEFDGTGLNGGVNVNAGGTLTGTGTINGIVTANAISATDALAGIVAPGPTFGGATGLVTGILGTGLANIGNGIFTVQINGTVAGTQYDQMSSFGVNVTGGTLNITLPSSFVPPVGAQYILINNTSSDPVTGIFSNFQNAAVTGGLVQGSILTINGYQFTLSYTGGTNGNSVVLTRTGTAGITITDTDSSTTAVPGTATTFTVVLSNTNALGGTVAHLALADAIPAGIVSDTYTSTQTGGVTNNTASGSGAINDGNLDLPGQSSVTYTIIDNIPSALTGTVVNSATVTALNGLTITGNPTATATVTLTPQSDLSVTNVVNPNSSVQPGTVVTYTVVAANNGPSDVTGATIVDTLPTQINSGDTFTVTTTGGASDTTNASSGTGSISDTINMPSGSTITYKIVGTVNANTTAAFTDTATISSPATGNTDPNSANNTATSTVSPLPNADLAVNITDNSGGTEIPGNTYTYTVTVSNSGPNPVTGATLASDFGTKLTGVSYSVTGTSNGASDTTHTSGTGNINDSVNLPVGGAITYSVVGTVLPSATGTLTTTATVTAPSGITDPNTSNNVSTDTRTLGNSSQADLQITNTEDATTYAAGTNVTYTIVATNAGPGNVTGASIADTFPANLTGVAYTVTTTGGASDTTHAASGTGNLGESVNLPVGSTITYVVTGSIPSSNATGTLSDTATIAVPGGVTDPVAGNNSATATASIVKVADLAVTNTTTTTSPVNAGGAVNYTVIVSNSGPSDITGATVTDTLPSSLTGMTYTVTSAGGAVDTTNASSGSGSLAETVNLPSGSSLTYVLNGTVASSAASGTLVTTASVSAPSGSSDPNTGNNSASNTLTISHPSADLSVVLTDNSGGTEIPGNTYTYTVAVANTGPNAVTGATVTADFGTKLTGVTYSVAGTTNGASDTTIGSGSGSGNISDSVNLPVGSTLTYTVVGTVLASASGTLTTTATVTAPSGITDSNTSNNVSTDTDALGNSSQADLQVTNSESATSYAAGTNVTYTVVAKNAGPGNVNAATVADTFSATLTGVAYTVTTTGGAVDTTNASSGTGNLGETVNMPSGSTITYVVTGSIPSSTATGTLSDTATITVPSGITDPNTANNTATVSAAITKVADLAVTNTTTTTSPVNAGGAVNYTVIVSNTGPSNITGATVTDPLPTSLTGVSYTVTSTGGAVDTTNASSGSGSLAETVNLPSGSSLTYVLNGTVSASAASGTLVTTASVSAPSGSSDPNTGNNSASNTLTISHPSADLSVVLTDNSGGTEIPGNTYTYTVAVANTGPNAVTGATVTADFGTKLTGVTYSVAGTTNGASDTTIGSGSGTGNISDSVNLPVGSTLTYTVVGTVLASASGTLTTTATVTAPSGITDSNTSNNVSTDTDALGNSSQADLRILASESSTSYAAGTNVTYTVVARNTGPGNVNGATVADTFSTTLTGVSYTVTGTGGAVDTTNAASGTGNLNETVNLPSGSTITYVVTGSIPSSTAAGTLNDTATITAPSGITDPNTTNNTSSVSASITKVADLAITHSDNGVTASGGTVSYTLVVTNNGPSDASGIKVSDVIGNEITGVTWTSTDGASGSGNSFSDSTLNLASGATATYTITGTINASATPGTVVNAVATVTAPTGVTDPASGNNTASDTLTTTGNVQADLQVTDSENATRYPAGTNVTYTVVARNGGPGSVTGATIADTFSTTLTGVSYTVTGTGGAVDTTNASSGTGNLNETVNLPSGGTLTYVVTGSIPSSTATGSLNDTATITAPSGVTDTNTANNTASVSATITKVADLAITHSDNGVTTPGGTVTYTLVVTNNGPSDASGIKVSDVIGNEITGVTWTSTDGASGSGNSFSDSTLNLASGATATYTITGTINAATANATAVSATATVAAPPGVTDTNSGNNSATDTITTGTPTQADLRITNSAGASTYAAGQAVTYTIIVTDAGPGNANGASVADTFSTLTGVTYTATSTGTASGYTSSSGNISDTVNLTSGSSITYVVTGTIPSSSSVTSISDTATVTAPSGVTDPNTANNTATATIAVNKVADLAITHSDNGVTASGGTVSYTLVVTNNGPSDASGIKVSDVIGNEITGVAWTSTDGASGSGNSFSDSTLNLASGATATYTITGTINASATPGTVVNAVATVTAPTGVTDPASGNNTASDTITTTGNVQADLQVTDSENATSYAAGTNVTYTVVAKNVGPGSVTGATIADTFASTLTGVSYTVTGTGGAVDTTNASSGTGNLNETVNLPSGGTLTYVVTGSIPSSAATGSLNDTATITAPSGVTDTNTANNTASVSATITKVADLAITNSDNGVTTPGGNVTYTLVVTNNGPSDASGIKVSDVIGNEITGVTWTSTDGASGSGNSFSDSTLNLASGATATYTITGTINAATANATAVSATATVAAPPGVTDTNSGNNSATDTITTGAPTQADLRITNSAGASTYAAGQAVTYTIIVTDAGPGNANGASVADTFSTLTGVTYTATSTGTASGYTSSSGNISDTVNLTSGSSITYVVTGTIPSSSSVTSISDTATVTAPSGVTDPNTANNSATATIAVNKVADLAITHSDNGVTASGGTVSYTLVVTNNGPSDASGIKVSDVIGNEITGVTWTSTDGASGSGNSFSDSTLNLASGATATYTITGTINASATPGTVVNAVATVTAPTGVTDPASGNNTASDTITTTGNVQADLQVTDSENATSYAAGTNVTYTVVAKNVGPGSVTGATIADTFASTLTGVSYTVTSTGGAVDTTNASSGTGNLNETVNLPSGSTLTYVVTGSIPSSTATGTLSDTATITASSGVTDTNTANNTSSVSATITKVADLAITHSDNGVTASGGTVSYTLVVTNNGPSDANGIKVSDVVGNEITGVTWTSTDGASGTGNSFSDSTLNLASGATATYTITGTINASATPGTVVNAVATVTAPTGVTDPASGNNTASDTITTTGNVQADLQVTDSENATRYPAGTNVTYTVVARNGGPGSVTGATIADTFSTTLTGVSYTVTGTGGAVDTTNASSGTGNLNETVNLPSGGTLTYVVTGSIPSSTATGTLSDTATITAPSGVTDTNTANNTASVSATITHVADLAVTNTTTTTSPVNAGGAVNYTVIVSNAGPSDIAGATVTDTLPSSLTGMTYTVTSAGGAVDTTNASSGQRQPRRDG